MEDKMMKFSFELGKDRKVSADLGKELVIDTSSPEALAKQLESAPAIMFYWGSASELAVVLETKAKNDFERWYASIYSAIKNELIDKYGKTATTESTIKHEIVNRYPDEMAKYNKELMVSRYKRSMLSLARDCFAKKNDNLINLLAYHRRLAENGG